MSPADVPPSSPTMVWAYLLYLVVSVGLTVWVARTLHTNGAPFLREAFRGKETLADSVNHLLVVGFYLINIGYVSLALRESDTIWTLQQLVELVCSKVGQAMVVLGGMHFLNLYVFSRIRRATTLREAPPPVLPRESIPVMARPSAA